MTVQALWLFSNMNQLFGNTYNYDYSISSVEEYLVVLCT